MKKLFLLLTVLGFFLSGCGAVIGSALSPIKSNYSADEWKEYRKKKEGSESWQMSGYEICKSGSDDGFKAKYLALCNKTFCGWGGFKNRDWCKENICDENASRDTFCESLDDIYNDIKGKGWKVHLERIRNADSLCNGKKPVHEFVADWERIYQRKCKNGSFDCVEATFKVCEVRAAEVEWLNRKKIEEQYEEKKAALCNGELLSRPYKVWFEWAICKEHRDILNQLNYSSFHGLLCPVLSEIFLKAEKESCGR